MASSLPETTPTITRHTTVGVRCRFIRDPDHSHLGFINRDVSIVVGTGKFIEDIVVVTDCIDLIQYEDGVSRVYFLEVFPEEFIDGVRRITGCRDLVVGASKFID